MSGIDQRQRAVIHAALGAAFTFWLFNQIADSTVFERIWHQLMVLALAVGAVRVWTLEGAKSESARQP